MSTPSAAHPDPAPESPPRPSQARIAFARVLAARPDHRDILTRLRAGHEPDQHGWCRHGAHAHRWERYPCPVIALAELINAAANPVTDDVSAADDVPVRGIPALRSPS